MVVAPPPAREHRAEKKGLPVPWIVAGVVLLAALGAGAFFFSGGKGKTKKRNVQMVSLVPAPPPTPAPTPPPTPPPPEPEPVEQPKNQPEFVEETKPDSPPEPEPDAPAPMGSNIQGDGPNDFGLQGRGGGGMIGGSGRGGGGGGSRFGWYAGRVQNAVASAVRTHKTTRSARLSVKARIWVDGSGRVTRAVLEGSSGDPAVDRALQSEVLSGMTLSDPPPQDMPMPIVMRINASR
jgi:TonB family protein